MGPIWAVTPRLMYFFFFQAEDGIRDSSVTGVQTCALPISSSISRNCSGLDKGSLAPEQFLEIDEAANVVRGDGRPSVEALLHLAIVRGVHAGAVLHTHSVWSTVLSGSHAAQGGIALEGYEMLKGLERVRTHKHREWLPILENSQDMIELGEHVSKTLQENS